MRYKQIIESVDLPDAVLSQAAEGLLDAIDWEGGDGETVMYMLGYRYNGSEYVDTDDDENVADLDSPEIKSKLKYWAKSRVENSLDNILYHFNGDIIRVYRMITAPKNWKPDPNRHPGQYWSWDKQSADAHWGSFNNGHVKWLMTADIHSNQIDWVQTLSVNSNPSQEDEAEITVPENVPIKLINYERLR